MELTGRARSERARSTLVLLLAPFAPHLAEELWARMGGDFSVHEQAWPVADLAALQRDEVEIAVQVDGRLRARSRVPVDADAREAVDAAMTHPDVVRALDGRQVVRSVNVPGKVVNLVTGTLHNG